MNFYKTISFVLFLVLGMTSLTLEAQRWNGPNNTFNPNFRSGDIGIGIFAPPATTFQVQGNGAWLEVPDFRSGMGNNIAGGPDNAAIGQNNRLLNDAVCTAVGGENHIEASELSVALGGHNFIVNSGECAAIGEDNTVTNGHGSVSIGGHNKIDGQYTMALGQGINNSGGENITIGIGGICAPLTNGTPKSLMVGFDSDIPTVFVGPSSGCGTTGNVGIGTSAPAQKLHVAGRIQSDALAPGGNVCADANGVLYISGPCGGGPGDDLGNHTATMPLDMSCNDIYNVNNIKFCNGNAFVAPASGEIFTTGSYAVGGPLYPLPGTVPGTVPYIFGVHGNAYIDGSLWVSSDKRYKKKIKTVANGLEIVEQLNGVSYIFDQENFPQKGFADGKTYGFIAQELAEVVPEVVAQDGDGYYRVNYDAIIPILAEAIKEQQEIIERKDEQLSNLEDRLSRLENLILKNNPGPSSIEMGFQLQNHPNPFSDATTISYQLPEGVTQARLEVYDLNGAKVMQENLELGTSSILVSGEKLNSGTYFYTIIANGLSIGSKKMMIQK